MAQLKKIPLTYQSDQYGNTGIYGYTSLNKLPKVTIPAGMTPSQYAYQESQARAKAAQEAYLQTPTGQLNTMLHEGKIPSFFQQTPYDLYSQALDLVQHHGLTDLPGYFAKFTTPRPYSGPTALPDFNPATGQMVSVQDLVNSGMSVADAQKYRSGLSSQMAQFGVPQQVSEGLAPGFSSDLSTGVPYYTGAAGPTTSPPVAGLTYAGGPLEQGSPSVRTSAASAPPTPPPAPYVTPQSTRENDPLGSLYDAFQRSLKQATLPASFSTTWGG